MRALIFERNREPADVLAVRHLPDLTHGPFVPEFAAKSCDSEVVQTAADPHKLRVGIPGYTRDLWPGLLSDAAIGAGRKLAYRLRPRVIASGMQV